jgi:hypothetical protein
VLDRLIGAVRGGESRALVLTGEAGMGKTALLEYLAVQALGCRVVRAAGVQSEMELAFAGLHQLCAPLLDRLEHLPGPQRDALRTAFGMSEGPAPDRFLVGLAVLGLLSEVAEQRPLICLIDDEQWLDRASAQVLAFVARRLGAESMSLVFAARTVHRDLGGVPELLVEGLREADARALLDAVLTGPIDARVRDQIVFEARGNPLALLELTRGLAPAELAGGFGLPGLMPLSGSVEENFLRRVGALPQQSRRLLLIAAADPSGDPALVWRAAGRLGTGTDAAAPATEAGLVEFGTRVRFRHPLARSAAYRSAAAQDRQAAHRALAEATDPRLDPDRRAWHRAQAAPGPDEDVAAELEHSAGRAWARGGTAAAAAFLKQAALLTLDPAGRAGRALEAARATIQAGAFDVAWELLAMAESGQLSDFRQASVDMMRAQLAFITSRGGDAPALLLRAAERLRPIDADLSRAAYLDALLGAIFAGRLAGPGGDVLEVARAAGAAPPPRHAPRASDLLLDGTAATVDVGYAAGVPVLRRALADFGAGMSAEEELRRMYLACITAIRLWDDDSWETLSARYLRLARETGTLSELPLALTARAYVLLFAGDLPGAASLSDELQAVKEATGSGLASYSAMGLAALRGDETGACAVIDATLEDVTTRGEGIGITYAEWANAALNNGLGHYDKAMAAGVRATRLRQRSCRDVLALGRADRGRRTLRDARDRGRRLPPALGDGRCQRHRLGPGGPGAVARAAERGRRSRAPVPRGDHPLHQDPTPGRSRPRASAVRGMAAPRTPPQRRTRTTAHGTRHAGDDGHDSVRRACQPRTAGRRRNRPQAHRPGPARGTDRPGRPDRPDGPRRPVEPGDRHPPVHQRTHRPVPLAQGLHQARHHLTQPARPGPAERPWRRMRGRSRDFVSEEMRPAEARSSCHRVGRRQRGRIGPQRGPADCRHRPLAYEGDDGGVGAFE